MRLSYSWSWLLSMTLALGSVGCVSGLDDDQASPTPKPADLDSDGYASDKDCDDSRNDVYPGAEALCDVEDANCDGSPDSPPDADKDGSSACPADGSPADCDDDSVDIHPGEAEACNGVDDNCDGSIDEGFDADGDGSFVCSSTPDCNDANGSMTPGGQEICDGLDNNCDGTIDEGFDQDADGVTSCAQPVADCNDENAQVKPGSSERCDLVDNDCDGKVDENFDLDQDGFTTECGEEKDCDDTRGDIYPGAVDICDNGIDEDCDGVNGSSTDGDGDTFVTCGDGPLDCNDADSWMKPGAVESCDARDNDCNGLIDDGVDKDENESNNDPETATNLGLINQFTETASGSISAPSDEDWFIFESSDDLNDIWRIEVLLTDIPEGANYDVFVYAQGDYVSPRGSGQNSGNTDESFTVLGVPGQSNSGQYLVRIFWHDGIYGCPSYTLQIYAD